MKRTIDFPTATDLAQLPKWACVAFAGRCVRAAAHLLQITTRSTAKSALTVHCGTPPQKWAEVETDIERLCLWTEQCAWKRVHAGEFGHADDLSSVFYFLPETMQRAQLPAAESAALCCREIAAIIASEWVVREVSEEEWISHRKPSEDDWENFDGFTLWDIPEKDLARKTAAALGHLLTATRRAHIGITESFQVSGLISDYESLLKSARQESWNNETPVSPHFFSEDFLIERRIAFAVNDLCVELCSLLAQDSRALWFIEWRQLEQILATVLDGIGFEVKLTPPAKDGGKDIVAECILKGKRASYYIEIKHWLKQRVGVDSVKHFMQVNVSDGTDGGLFLSSSGFAKQVYSQLSEITRTRVRLGSQPKIISLCQHYVQERKSAVWQSSKVLPDILFSETF